MRWIEPLLAASLTFTPGWTQEQFAAAPREDLPVLVSTVAAGNAGGGLVGTVYDDDCAVSLAAMRPATPPPELKLNAELWFGPVASGTGYVALLDSRECGGSTIELVDLDADGQIVRRTALPTSRDADPGSFVTGADGSLTILYAGVDGLSTLTRGADGRLGRPVTVTRWNGRAHPGALEAVEAARADDGRVLIAWARDRKVRAVTISPDGRASVPSTLGRTMGRTGLDVAQRGDHAVVAWSTQDPRDLGTEMHSQRARLYASIHDGRRLRPARLITRARGIDEDYDPLFGPDLTLGEDGHALLRWTSTPPKSGWDTRLAEARPGHGFGKPRATEVWETAFAPDGSRVAAWGADGRIFVERAGVRVPLALAVEPSDMTLAVLPDGRVRVTWTTGQTDDAPVLHVATSNT
jgi:hypothetical protein